MSIVSTEPTDHPRHERRGRARCGVTSTMHSLTVVCVLPILHPGEHHSSGISWPRLVGGDR